MSFAHTVSRELTFSPRFIEKASDGEVNHALRKSGVGFFLNGRRLPPEAFELGFEGYSPVQLVSEIRRDLARRSHHLKMGYKTRLRYINQVYRRPESTRRLMAQYMGLTFLPGDGNVAFPEETKYWDLDNLQVLTTTARLGRLNDMGSKIDIFDVRLQSCMLDRNSGVTIIGGHVEDGINLTTLSRWMSIEPGRDDPRAIPLGSIDVINAALSLHEDVEMVAISHYARQTAPRFPTIVLGFDETVVGPFEDFITEDITIDNPYLKSMAVNQVKWWLRQGCMVMAEPVWPDSLQNQLRRIEPDMFDGWATLEAALTPEDSEFLLSWCYERSITKQDGMTMLPLAVFKAEGIDVILKKATRVLVDMEGFLGRDVVMPDGTRQVDKQQARNQIIMLASNGGLDEQLGAVEWHLGECEAGMENDFA